MCKINLLGVQKKIGILERVVYSGTSLIRTYWDQSFCPLFRGYKGHVHINKLAGSVLQMDCGCNKLLFFAEKEHLLELT